MNIFEPFNTGQLTDIDKRQVVYSSNKHQFYPTTNFTTPTPRSKTSKLFKVHLKSEEGII